MGFFIKSKNRIWCGDLKWKIYSRKAGFLTIRNDARHYTKITRNGAGDTAPDKHTQMTHYVRVKDWPDRVGFVHLEKLPQKMALNSLLLAVVRHFGAEFYGEFEVGINQFWVVATDERGFPLPGSDGIYSSDDATSLRERFSGYRFSQTKTLDQTDFTILVDNLPECPIRLRTLSLQPVIAFSIMALCIMGVAGELVHIYEEKLRAERVKLARNKIKMPAVQQRVPAIIRPSDWITTCLKSVPDKYFYQGWILQDWLCKTGHIALKWHRSGGTLTLAPTGDILDNGNIVVTTLALHPPMSDKQQFHPTANEAEFIALLQSHGITLARSTTDIIPEGSGQGAITSSSISFNWPTDLHSLPWDQISGLQITEIGRETVPVNGASQNGPMGSYMVKVQITPPANPNKYPEIGR